MKKAFTLSEVLVTLGIIAVIAALTIPTVVKNYRYKMYASQLQKAYSQVQNATKNIMTDEMTDDFYKTTGGTKSIGGECSKGPCYFLTKYFKLAREDCGYKSSKKCVADSYVSSSGANAGKLIPGDDAYCAQTINGATICMISCEWTNYATRVVIDVNGPDAPNTVGLDACIMNIQSDGTPKDWENPDQCNVGTPSETGDIVTIAPGCLNKVINNGWVIKD